MISSFILSYSFSTSFIKTNLSWLILESIKALEIKTSMLFNLDYASNIILSGFFFFFLIINLYSLIPAVIAQIFNPIAELVILIGIPRKDANKKLEIHALNVEAKIRKCSVWFRVVQTFLCFLLINSFCTTFSRT